MLGVRESGAEFHFHRLDQFRGGVAVSRIAFVLRSLEVGGAERQAVTLANGLAARGHEVEIVTFYGTNPLARELKLAAGGIRLSSLGKRGRYDFGGFSLRLRQRLRELRPDVVYSWLSVPNVFCAALRPFLPSTRLVWTIRTSRVDLASYGTSVKACYALESLLSSHVDRVVANSWAGRNWAVEHGYDAARIVVVPNGFDTDRFRPSPEHRKRQRDAWEVSDDEWLVGLVARSDPLKGHGTFLKAAALAAREMPKARFAIVGAASTHYFAELKSLADKLGISKRVIWEPPADRPERVFPALDACALTSRWEGFPNVVGEAMACGVPCVVTDVGDTARLVGSTGWVACLGDVEDLAAAFRQAAVSAALPERRRAARRRVIEEYSFDALVTRTETALLD